MKEQIDGLAKILDELRLGMDDGDGAHALQEMQGTTLLTSVVSIPLCWVLHLILSSAMGRMDEKLRDISDCVKSIGSTGRSNEKALGELVDEIRAAVNVLRVSSNSRARLVTLIRLINPVSHISARQIWRTASTSTKGLLRTQRIGRDDCRPYTTLHIDGSNWNRRNWQNVHRLDGPQ